MKEALIINLFGGPGISKSTTAAGVFSLLKLHDVECELVTEFAKELVWEERKLTLKNQQYIFGEQYHRLWRVADKVDVVITDCPLLLGVVYGSINKNINTAFINNVLKSIEEFDNINVVLNRVKKYSQNGRNETEEQAKEIDKKIIETFNISKMWYTKVDGNYEGINDITEIILSRFSKEIKFRMVMS
jgi:hypothetical protein